MNAKMIAAKMLLLGAVLGAAALLSQPAHAGGYDGRGHYDGRYDYGYSAGWSGQHQRRQGRRYHREYGWYVPGHYYRDIDYRDGRVWCPIRRVYVLASQRHDNRGRHDRRYRDRDHRYAWHDDRDYGDYYDDRGYYDRDRDYRGW